MSDLPGRAGPSTLMHLLLQLQASRKLHERMAFAIFRSPMTFFETTPAGRILNRFSRFELPLLMLWRKTAGRLSRSGDSSVQCDILVFGLDGHRACACSLLLQL